MHDEIFEDLLRRIVPQDGVDQIIALRAASGRTYVMENRDIMSGDHGDEDLFLHSLQMQGDPQVTHLVCQWFDGSIDITSMHFREGLLSLSPENANTLLLLQGEGHYVVWPLQRTMPQSPV